VEDGSHLPAELIERHLPGHPAPAQLPAGD
jgi:hypothetical protein